MRGVSQAAVLLLLPTLGPVITHGQPTRRRTADAAIDERPVLWWRDTDGVVVQFQTPCAGCESKYLPIKLGTASNNGVCENVTVSVNGRELKHQWDGKSASGSGTIPVSSSHYEETELLASWQSICLTAPLDALSGRDAHILTLVLNNGTSSSQDNVGFTISFTFVEQIEILRVSNFPIQLSDEEWETWSRPQNAGASTTEQNTSPEQVKPELDSMKIEVEIETELQKLQYLRYQSEVIQHLINSQEEKIHELLRQDCTSLFTQWKQCNTLACYFESSWKSVPEIYRSIKYRFGPLESQRLFPICPPPKAGDAYINDPPAPSAEIPSPTAPASASSQHTATPSTTSTFLALPAITDIPPSLDIPHPLSEKHNDNFLTFDIPLDSPTKTSLRSYAILALIILILTLVFRTLRRSTAFRRRRRDLASRREEQRTRRAYRNAARRLRWRQWWEGGGSDEVVGSGARAGREGPGARTGRETGRSSSLGRSVTSSHSLPDLDHPPNTAALQHSNNDANPFPSHNTAEESGGIMHAEILGLRRVLEYVGELVETNNDSNSSRRTTTTRSRSHSRPPPQYEDIDGQIAGVGSPRASTMFSLETGSLVTLETLDTDTQGSEGAPPSYHA
ncbi:hypothetical protein BGW36DRAFT_17863 [Talaromyces proteolyticus]|uniref:Uncharacterized protein n=1 Tax=Talaromyces proteolyticus TaxID=1131652 RepID=A0AAD4Q440_9EURO|nr:uncharacterized protein BGW36DRAFT_17863 [Talaromyces proteolyticus]KAH8705759.1 hypothetical protein BGW36DRAFT_17863 [Talaromyces proteolyticus]